MVIVLTCRLKSAGNIPEKCWACVCVWGKGLEKDILLKIAQGRTISTEEGKYVLPFSLFCRKIKPTEIG